MLYLKIRVTVALLKVDEKIEYINLYMYICDADFSWSMSHIMCRHDLPDITTVTQWYHADILG